MEKAKIEELLKKHNLEGKFNWKPETVISDLVREYLFPTFMISISPNGQVSSTIDVPALKERAKELNDVVNFYDDVDSIEKQDFHDHARITNIVFKYRAVGKLLNMELKEEIFPKGFIKLPRIC